MPDALQGGDRWHIWHSLAQTVGKEVAVHSGCWATASWVRKVDGGKTTTLQWWQQVHDLLDAGVGLLECARRLDLALNTVKRYARIADPAQMRRAPQCRPALSSRRLSRLLLGRRNTLRPDQDLPQLTAQVKTTLGLGR
ncbi:hypothetical protein [Actinoallomurus sp. NPDC052274]|uniref:hypothetical protein n=1 Tax=Actinoallomurus sp. NPDC052274 TaxID=3155420 RepID=UPI003445C194